MNVLKRSLVSTYLTFSALCGAHADSGLPSVLKSSSYISKAFEPPIWPDIKRLCTLDERHCYGMFKECSPIRFSDSTICFLVITDYRKKTDYILELTHERAVSLRLRNGVMVFLLSDEEPIDYLRKPGDVSYVRIYISNNIVTTENCLTNIKRGAGRRYTEDKMTFGNKLLEVLATLWLSGKDALCKDQMSSSNFKFLFDINAKHLE